MTTCLTSSSFNDHRKRLYKAKRCGRARPPASVVIWLYILRPIHTKSSTLSTPSDMSTRIPEPTSVFLGHRRVLVICSYVTETPRKAWQDYVQRVHHQGDPGQRDLRSIGKIAKRSAGVPDLLRQQKQVTVEVRRKQKSELIDGGGNDLCPGRLPKTALQQVRVERYDGVGGVLHAGYVVA